MKDVVLTPIATTKIPKQWVVAKKLTKEIKWELKKYSFNSKEGSKVEKVTENSWHK